MLPLQEIKIKTKNNREFYVHLEKLAKNNYDCKLAEINLGPQLTADPVFRSFAKGQTASDAFNDLIQKLTQLLSKLDATDSVSMIDNPCNTEFINKIDQEHIVDNSVFVLVNGK